MPYTYPVEVRESSINGKGLFAAGDIPKGAVYWVYHCDDPLPVKGATVCENGVYSREDLERVDDPAELKAILHGGIFLKDCDLFMAFRDGSEYMNHSFDPNSQIRYPESKDYRELVSYALRDIRAGEEITEHY
jgi:SET domain-containing protein